MKITWFGHSAFRLETGGSVILIDPFITGNSVATVKADVAGRGATHVALTHGHEDHVGDAEAICKANNATLIAVHEICEFFGKKGLENCEGPIPAAPSIPRTSTSPSSERIIPRPMAGSIWAILAGW